jgi:hypothetical protein
MAWATSWSRRAVAARCTAELTRPAPAEPTAEEVFGSSVSPSSKRTRSSGMPSPSAATCDIAVATPVPNSWVPHWTTALPSAYRRASARWGCSPGKAGTG